MATLASELDALDEHGFVVLPALLSAREVDASLCGPVGSAWSGQ